MKSGVESYEKFIQSVADTVAYTVFLCGPTMEDLSKPSAALRKRIKDELLSEGFDVVLGEDDGLERLQKDFGGDAQTNEVCFLEKSANAVVVIADSPGSFAELGLFSHVHSGLDRFLQFILLINKSFDGINNYICLGPVQVVNAHGRMLFVDFDEPELFNEKVIKPVLDILKTAKFRYMIKQDK